MSKIDKVIEKIMNGSAVSYQEAERVLLHIGFTLRIKSSHHIFTREDYDRNISLKKRSRLILYQVNLLQEVLTDHGY